MKLIRYCLALANDNPNYPFQVTLIRIRCFQRATGSCGVYSEHVYADLWICLKSSWRNNKVRELPVNRTLSTAFLVAPTITKELATPKLTRELRVSFQLSLSDEEEKYSGLLAR